MNQITLHATRLADMAPATPSHGPGLQLSPCVYGIIRITPNRMVYMHGQTDTRAGKHFNHILPFYLSILRPEKERTTSWYFKWFALPIPNQIKHCHNLLWHQWYASFSHVIVRTWLLSTPNMHLPNAEFIVSRVSHQSYVTCHYIYIYYIYIYMNIHTRRKQPSDRHADHCMV